MHLHFRSLTVNPGGLKNFILNVSIIRYPHLRYIQVSQDPHRILPNNSPFTVPQAQYPSPKDYTMDRPLQASQEILLMANMPDISPRAMPRGSRNKQYHSGVTQNPSPVITAMHRHGINMRMRPMIHLILVWRTLCHSLNKLPPGRRVTVIALLVRTRISVLFLPEGEVQLLIGRSSSSSLSAHPASPPLNIDRRHRHAG